MAPEKKYYSAKSARAGKDVGKRGKNFSKISPKRRRSMAPRRLANALRVRLSRSYAPRKNS